MPPGRLERSTNAGKTWEAITFPQPVTITAVRAPSATTAIVTAADGRQFRTDDQGKTWSPGIAVQRAFLAGLPERLNGVPPGISFSRNSLRARLPFFAAFDLFASFVLCKKSCPLRSKTRRSTLMAVRFWIAVPTLALAGALAAHMIDSRPVIAAPAPGLPERLNGVPPVQDASTLDDQTELALTVYNSDLALVRDVRTLQLPRGVSDLRFMDVAATVNPATVHFRSLTEPAASACSNRTTSTTCSSRRSCFASTSDATSRWCARVRKAASTAKRQ